MAESNSLLESAGGLFEVGSSESPFLPDSRVQYAWDSTSLGWLKRCPRLYYYHMILGWRPKDEPIHLRFGIEYHNALHKYELHRQLGASHQEALHTTVKDLLLRTAEWDSDHPNKNRKTLTRTVIWYLEKFQHDTTKSVELKDGKLACELSFRFQLDWGPKSSEVYPQSMDELLKTDDDPNKTFLSQHYLLCGHLDRVVTFNDELFVMDRKTTKYTLGSYYFDNFDPDNQMSLYTLAGQVLFETAIRGVIIDAAQVAVGFSAFERGFTYRNSDQIDEWVNGLRFWLALAEEYAKAGHWPMNDTACSMYGGCKFRGICSKSPSVRENFLRADFTKETPWNPLVIR
jgi:hypothetical protein